jgi:hypothetical protein
MKISPSSAGCSNAAPAYPRTVPSESFAASVWTLVGRDPFVRPSAMFGPGDALFSTLADLTRLLPVVPLIGGGRMRLQPVYVEDVVKGVVRILADPGAVG